MANTYRIEVEGTAALLMHSPESLKDQKQGRDSGTPDPEVEARKALYKDGEGNIVVPSRAIEGAMREAAKDFPVSGKGGKKSYKEYIMAGILVEPENIPLQTLDGTNPNEAWVIDLQPVVVQKSRIMRSRPRFDQWKLQFNLTLLDPLLDPKIVQEILEAAGKYKGLLDYRPRNGRFRVTCFEPVGE